MSDLVFVSSYVFLGIGNLLFGRDSFQLFVFAESPEIYQRSYGYIHSKVDSKSLMSSFFYVIGQAIAYRERIF